MRKDVMTMRRTTIGFLVALALSLLAAMPSVVAYLQRADIVSSPLPCHLDETNQPVISTPTVFSTPRPTLLVCI